MRQSTTSPRRTNNNSWTAGKSAGSSPDELPCAQRLLDEHHYLGSLKPVGERLNATATEAQADWLGVLVFCAATRRPLIVGTTRFLLLPHKTVSARSPSLKSPSCIRDAEADMDDFLALHGNRTK